MDKKPLIGVSILAVVLLVLGSLSNVVGYQSVKSTINDSPLFATRTQRATNQQQNSMTYHYIGKGEISNLVFPLMSDITPLFNEIINRVQAMDESSFNQFVTQVVTQIHNQDTLKNYDTKDLIKELYNVRKNTGRTILDWEINDEKRTILYNYVPTACWFPGCYILDILLLIYIIITLYEMNKQTILLSACVCPLLR